MFELPVLLGDVGGTNARFALLESADAPARTIAHEHTRDFPDPVAAIRRSLEQEGRGVVPRSALLAVAGRVDAPVVHLTNAHWTIDARAIGEGLGLGAMVVVNDFVPLTAALSRLGEADVAPIGPGRAEGDLAGDREQGEGPRGARVVLGPGTGFGIAALVPFGDRFAIVSSEAGHADFGPTDEDEEALWPKVERVEGRRTVETLLSGPGLSRIHAALSGKARLAPNDVMEAGLSGDDATARRALELFAKLLGRYAGDAVLTFGATGGVFVAGGIAPRMIEVLRAGAFRAAFERKPPYVALMRATATAVITAPDPALIGLAALATETERFAFDVQGWWREREADRPGAR